MHDLIIKNEFSVLPTNSFATPKLNTTIETQNFKDMQKLMTTLTVTSIIRLHFNGSLGQA